MKIAIIADALDTQEAGIHRYTRCLLDAMYKLNTDHTFHIIRASNKKCYPKWNEHTFPIKPLPLNLRLRQLTVIPKKLNRLRPDVVLETAHFGPFRLDPNIKRVTMIHDVTPITHPDFHPYSSVLAHKFFLKGILKKADRVITNSKSTTSDVNRLFPFTKGKTVSIPLAAAMKARSSQDISKDSIKLPPKYLLHVGTIEPRKNLELLVKAFELMEDDNLHLVLAGKVGWKASSTLKAIIDSPKKDKIHQLGRVSENLLRRLYKGASIFVYPSHYEGFGLPILEAMLEGTPVVCSSNSSLSEVGGNAVKYISENDKTKLANTLTTLLSDSSQLNEMRRLSKEQVAKFRWKRTAEKTLENLIEVCV